MESFCKQNKEGKMLISFFLNDKNTLQLKRERTREKEEVKKAFHTNHQVLIPQTMDK